MSPNKLSAEVRLVAQPLEPESLQQLSSRMETLIQVQGQSIASIRENTEAVVNETNALYRSSVRPHTESKAVTNSLGAGLFLSPLIRGIASLFGKKGRPEPPPLTPYERPEPMRTEAALSFSDSPWVPLAGYDSEGVLRTAGPAFSTAIPAAQRTPAMGDRPAQQNEGGTATPSPVTININALDSRSILERSDDIARAVQQALLHSHSLNNTIGEL